MSYKKELIPLLLVSKKLNELIKNCSAGLVAKQILPQSSELTESKTHEFIFKKVLQIKNIKHLFVGNVA